MTGPSVRRCYPGAVRAVRAHVQNGQIVLDEPVELPEGVAVEVLIPDPDNLTADERISLEEDLEDSAAQPTRGELEDANELARRTQGLP